MPKAQSAAVLQYLQRLLGTPWSGVGTDGELLERFITGREEAAFARLMYRHGPMVLSVCQRVLHHEQDAEDVFQATFLVLARQAGAIRQRDSVGSWLHGVAYRLALKARLDRTRRQKQEALIEERSTPEPLLNVAWRELQEVLDHELTCVPEKYRTPLLLCYLEGRTHEEAAQQLSCPVGTVKSRLARGRDLLRRRLVRRGLDLSTTAFTAALAAHTVSAQVPVVLVKATAAAGLLFASGSAVPSGVSAHVASLAEGVVHAVGMSKLQIAGTVLLVFSLMATGAGVLTHSYPAGEEPGGTTTKTPSALPNFPGIQQVAAAPARTDLYGDPLPPGALQRLGTVQLRHLYVSVMAFSPTGTTLASGGSWGWGSSEPVRLWDVATGKELHKLTGPQSSASSVAFSPDGKLLASGHFQTVHLWEVATGREIRKLGDFNEENDAPPPRGTDGNRSLAFAPDGSVLAAAEGERCIRLWEVATGKELGQLEKQDGPFRQVAFTRDGKTLIEVRENGTIRSWDVARLRELGTFVGPPRSEYGHVALAQDGNTLVFGGPRELPQNRMGGTLCLWDVANAKEVRRFAPLPRAVAGLTLSADGKTLAWVDWSSSRGIDAIHLWDVASDRELRQIPVEPHADRLALSHDGKILAAANGTSIRLWEVATGRQLVHRPGHDSQVTGVAFSPDGTTLVSSSSSGGTFALWDVVSGQQHRLIRGPTDRFWFVRYAPDGRSVFTGGTGEDSVRSNADFSAAGYRIQLWDIGTGQELQCCQGHNSKVITLAFSHDDTRLACGLDDTTVLIWDVTPGLQRARRPVRDLSRAEREQLWAELAAEEAAKAHQAIGRLVAASGTAVDFLQERMQPRPELSPEPLRRLIRDLESPQFAAREAAFQEIKRLGEEVEPILNQALEGNPTLELRRRVESLLASSHLVRDAAKLRRLRALHVLEQIGTPEARPC